MDFVGALLAVSPAFLLLLFLLQLATTSSSVKALKIVHGGAACRYVVVCLKQILSHKSRSKMLEFLIPLGRV